MTSYSIVKGMYVNDSARVDDKVIIVTGSNTGIGKAAALELAKRGEKIYFACRSEERAMEALNEVKTLSNNENLHFLQLDLNSLESVREFSRKFHELESKLDILINNAAVLSPMARTDDGFEKNIGVNHLGHFLLTHLLLDLLKASAPSRIIVVASDAHKYGAINKEDFNSERTEAPISFRNALKAYGTSKLCNILFTRELSRKLTGSGVVVNTLCPGNVHTEATRYLHPAIHYVLSTLKKYFKKTPLQGCQTILMLSVDAFYADKSGDYYVDCAKTEPYAKALDDEMAKWLWDKSLELTGLKESDLFL